MDAVKIVRKVYVRHPNYGDLIKGLANGGVEGLDDRVPVSVGEWSRRDSADCRDPAITHAGLYH
jgi:hypothetical protein